MGTVSLNLSRKWRSQNFDQVIGQDLAVRILKNTLYLGHYFPVYLFAGQRGCGKTTTARIFAAALNCAMLPQFQKNPKKFSIPCLECQSCVAMREGNHPDFIEIDAASHTGVDNIRNIIESSALLPILGRKRVYLIDEAHMLSKSAFNAALKILEEPPATALFILATTNQHKIIDTVRSRCFQLFFNAIARDSLVALLSEICEKEHIVYEKEALHLIVRKTEGSARDALNLLEQVRFSSSAVNEIAVKSLLGHIGDNQLLDIIALVLQGNCDRLTHVLLSLQLESYNAEFIWQRLVELLRALMWVKNGAQPRFVAECDDKKLVDLSQKNTLAHIMAMVVELYEKESLFLKTNKQHIFLEMILLALCTKNKKKPDDENGSQAVVPSFGHEIENDDTAKGSDNAAVRWSLFVDRVKKLNDPLVQSLFQQAQFVQHKDQRVVVECAKELALFKDRVEATRSLWQSLLHEIFNEAVYLDVCFSGVKIASQINMSLNSGVSHCIVRDVPVASSFVNDKKKEKSNEFFAATQGAQNVPRYKQKTSSVLLKNEAQLDVSDENVWKVAPMLLRHFPGIISEIREH